MTVEAPDTSAEQRTALLRAMSNLTHFHREHEKFYASTPREEAVRLQRHARSLQALADKWSTTAPLHPSPFSPFEGTFDLNAFAATQLDGVLFMEGEGEPAEISHLKRELHRDRSRLGLDQRMARECHGSIVGRRNVAARHR